MKVRFKDQGGATRIGSLEDGVIEAAGNEYSFQSIDILPPCKPSKIVCVGRNYAKHAEELGNEIPDRPLLFLKPPNAVAGHNDVITLPKGKEKVEHEAELAVVIGEQCRHIDKKDALNFVEGYTCLNDISNRDDQRKEKNWVRGKAFDGAAPIGPGITPLEKLPSDASIQSYVNGELRQDGSLDSLIFSIPELIAEITTYLTLEPGDVIATGTPEGVGLLSDGDRVTIEIDGAEPLEHTVIQ